MNFRQAVSVIRRVKRGQTMTEYALILATIAAVIVSLYGSAGTIISELVGQVIPLLTGH
jgi:Flp pilus assembly pilin Flp